MQSYQNKDHLVIDGKHPNHLSKKLKIEIKATATTVIELSLTYSPLSKGNTFVEEPKLERYYYP